MPDRLVLRRQAGFVEGTGFVRLRARTGKVMQVLPTENRVVVQGVNMVQRHTRPTQADPQGGIKHKEASLHLSNVAIADANGKATRVGFKVDGDKKVRFAKTTGDVI